jgi:hypothetical protein
VLHLTPSDATIVINIDNTKCFTHMGESLWGLFPNLLEHVVKLIADLGYRQTYRSSGNQH